MSTRYAIEARGVRRLFGDVVALNGIDLRVDRGTLLALLGPNGAGKTTLVLILSTLLVFGIAPQMLMGMCLEAVQRL